jgi:hypothetical protein
VLGLGQSDGRAFPQIVSVVGALLSGALAIVALVFALSIHW